MNKINSTWMKNGPKSDFNIIMKNIRDSNKKTSFECKVVILEVIDQMKAAVEEDKNLQKQKMATKKPRTPRIDPTAVEEKILKFHRQIYPSKGFINLKAVFVNLIHCDEVFILIVNFSVSLDEHLIVP